MMATTDKLYIIDPNADEAKRQRRRIQNKLNQRARRQRVQENRPESQHSARRPYRVGRWRLEFERGAGESNSVPVATETTVIIVNSSSEGDRDRQETSAAAKPRQLLALTASVNECGISTYGSFYRESGPSRECDSSISVSADHHLLHLIHLNVSRGLRQNKAYLLRFTSYYLPGYTSPNNLPTPTNTTEVHPDVLFYGSTLIATSENGFLPNTLAPTKAQMSLVHATWINILPFPRMRENLIRWEGFFDHAEFIQDLVGDLVDTRPMSSTRQVQADSALSGMAMPRSELKLKLPNSIDDDDEITANRNGLIIWGEPYNVESWELTPGFLRKWMWTVEGCEELIASSNYWRRVRGEESIDFRLH
ncbi:DUF3425 domain-containing protein [Aspergillus undulatus]|uniref:DUF3425 domain-containing protein n=1 Tax=Aspergillus undulatus TaxID=1810928 RepID=UPI003CCE08CF